jgi:Xaa-Pro aminopeptidase
MYLFDLMATEGDHAGVFRRRRARVGDAIGGGAVALVRGAPAPRSSRRFRQLNELYHLTGVEVPHAYLLIEGGSGSSALFLPPRDEHRAENEGRELGAEDVELITALSGVERVAPLAHLASELARLLLRSAQATLLISLAPGEGERASRDSALDGTARRCVDPWTDTTTAEACFAELLRARFPRVAIGDLSPTLDELRTIKDELELELMRGAGRVCAEGVLEAMRSTAPGVFEYELEAVAEFVFKRAGARGGAYQAIVAGGGNAWHGHYGANDSALREGDLVLMDYAPDLRYYASDIGRMWPVDGVFSAAQLELYGFIVRYHRALLGQIRADVSINEALDGAAGEMSDVVEEWDWSQSIYEAAARNALAFRKHLSHPVGMAVHDVGNPQGVLREGYVFSVDPMLWVPEERLYVRVEDTVVVTRDGHENLTAAVPIEPAEVEAVMREPGLLDWRGRA